MFIKSIVLDGFKSYGKRTEIVGFDQLFNAITGLNGSGKSNILDAICFALGLSNMSLARCTTLRELIFKNGQAGVHKAIVTVTFDNSDKDQSPTGYEHLNEIVIRREVHLNSRTKYYVCGQSVSNNQVSDLFHSVQLNISNPHFLIMQGRITKVLNMKPHDILAMMEETTGVSMYEVKKKSTQVMFEKKDQALKSIDSLIDETILPKLNQLRKEYANLLDYRNLVGELDKLNKQYIAWQFAQNQKKADHAQGKTDECGKKVVKINTDIENLDHKLLEVINKIKTIERHNDELSGGQVAKLEESLMNEERIEIKECAKLEKLVDALGGEEKKKKDIEKQLSGDNQLKNKRQKEYDNISQEFDKIQEEYKIAEANHERYKKEYEAIASGKALDEDGKATASLADQLIKAEDEYNNSTTEMKIAKTKLTNCKRELIRVNSDAVKHKAQFEDDTRQMADLGKVVDKLKEQLDSLNYHNRNHELQSEKDSKVKRLTEIAQSIQGEPKVMKFECSPIPGLDPKCIKGIAHDLFTLKDAKYARAVEAAAGGKLYHVIVDTNDQCREIMDKGNLKIRYNLVALNKIQGRSVDKRSVEAAKRLANDENVVPVQDLIEFDPSLKRAMDYIFGDVMVASDVEKATKITYSHLKLRTVTFDGDIVMTGGDMKGGAVPKSESILSALLRMRSKIVERNELEQRLREIQQTMSDLEKRYLTLEGEFKLNSNKLENIRHRLTSSHQMGAKHLEQEIEELEARLVNLQTSSEQSSRRIQELKLKLNTQDKSREKELEAAEKTLSSSKKQADAKKKLIDQRKSKVESLRLEIDDLMKSCQQYEESISKLDKIIEEKQVLVDEQTKILDEVKAKVASISGILKEQKQKIHEQNEEINKLSKKRDKIYTEINEKKLDIKKLQHEIEQINSEAEDASQVIRAMLRKYDWIAEEKHLFGKDNSDYPFHRKDFSIKDLTDRVQKLQTTKSVMQKTVNQRANILLSDKEKEAEELRSKRLVIEQDRDKLMKYIEEVDRRKKDALHKAWRKINIDFDSIFSTFLPNTHAKLDLVPGKDLLDGLEIKVAFGEVWKESLTELSGGQRSLVALSLILALLKYNPAPLYILDEVDAALDQNHTQNTGTMIKKHFNKSQFIIVSLKDDMFRNANVLFKTKFVDGKSTVMRYTHSK